LALTGVIVDDDPDETLVERCRDGDGSAFAALVGRYHRPIYNAAFRVLGNADDAADITQVVFMRVTEHLDDFDSRFKFFSWIYRIALNESLNMARKHGREEPLDEEAEIAAARSAEADAGRSFTCRATGQKCPPAPTRIGAVMVPLTIQSLPSRRRLVMGWPHRRCTRARFNRKASNS